MPDVHERFENQLHQHAKRIIPPGSFIMPLDAAIALGKGNGELGESIIGKMFAAGRYSEAMPRILPPEVVKEIGHGDIAAGRKVLERFVQSLRQKHQHEAATPTDQSDNEAEHGYRYERVPLRQYAKGGRVDKINKADADYEACGDSGRICAICSMYRDENKCTLVNGFISRTGTCRHFQKA
jgi:hypothetical protein